MTSIRSKIYTARQTSTNGYASAYGCCLVSLSGTPAYTMILWTYASNGVLEVDGVIGTPDWYNYD